MTQPVAEPDDDDKPDDDKPEPFTPPSEEEWKRTLAALEKANAEAKNHRLKLREREAEMAKLKPEPADEKSIRAALQAEMTEKYKAPAVRTAARLALRDAGYVGDPSPRVLSMINLADCDVSDDGEVSGLDAQVREIKKDFPALFAAAAPRAPKAPIGPEGATPSGRKLSSAERIAAGVLHP